jgi:hypothetical protein
MKLIIKYAVIEIENDEHGLEIVDELEKLFQEQSTYYKWDWETED